MTVDFKKLLSEPVNEEAKRPPSLPAGTYYGTITKHEVGESANKKTPYIRFFVQLTTAGEEHDPESLAGVDLMKRQMRRDYYLTEDALYRLHEVMSSCDVSVVGRSLGESLPEMQGKDVIVTVNARPNKDDPTQPPYNEIVDMKGKPD